MELCAWFFFHEHEHIKGNLSKPGATGLRTSDAIKRLVKVYQEEQVRQEYQPRYSPTADRKNESKSSARAQSASAERQVKRRVSNKSPSLLEESPPAATKDHFRKPPKATLEEIQRAFGVGNASPVTARVQAAAVEVMSSQEASSPGLPKNPVLQEYSDEGENALIRLFQDGTTEVAKMSDPENGVFRIGTFENGDEVVTCY